MNENMDTLSTHPLNTLHLSKTLIALFVVLVILVATGAGAAGAYFYASATHSGTVASAPASVFHNPPPPALPVIHTVAGTVAAIKGNTLTLASVNAGTVLINSSTVILKYTIKNPQAFQTQLNAFLKAKKAGTQATPPQPSIAATTINASGIPIGARIIVTSTQNILALQFTASKIQVYPKSPINNLK